MRSTHMASSSYGTSHTLIVESRNEKIFKFSLDSYIYVPFQSFFADDPDLVEYYQKTQVKAKCFVHGSCSFNQRMRPFSSDDGDSDFDDEFGNLSNRMEY